MKIYILHYGYNHTSVSQAYNNIGSVFEIMGNFKKA